MKSKKFVLAGLVLLAAITMVLLPLSGCKNDTVPPEAHTHTFDEKEWKSDATGHWHPATCGHTGEKGGFASHTFGDWEVEEASATVKKVVEECAECGYTQEVAGFVYIPAGTFKMGSTAGDSDEKPAHDVTISKGYFMGKCEVTQKEYEKYCSYTGGEDTKPTKEYGEGDDYPAYYVSWYDAVVYCNRRSIAERLTPCYAIGGKTNPDEWGTVPTSNDSTWNGVTCNWEANGYRLPTEAEWEYAARAGDDTTNARTWSGTKTEDDLGTYAWYSKNSGSKTHQVGTKKANDLNLYDMSGNVWEWCWDWYGDYGEGSVSDPHGGSSGDGRVSRGGDWDVSADLCAVSSRNYYDPSLRYYTIGFRLVRPSSK